MLFIDEFMNFEFSRFDMDGLVLDTESIYTKVQDTIAGEVGKTFGWDLKAKIMGMKGVDACQCIVRDTS